MRAAFETKTQGGLHAPTRLARTLSSVSRMMRIVSEMMAWRARRGGGGALARARDVSPSVAYRSQAGTPNQKIWLQQLRHRPAASSSVHPTQAKGASSAQGGVMQGRAERGTNSQAQARCERQPVTLTDSPDRQY